MSAPCCTEMQRWCVLLETVLPRKNITVSRFIPLHRMHLTRRDGKTYALFRVSIRFHHSTVHDAANHFCFQCVGLHKREGSRGGSSPPNHADCRPERNRSGVPSQVIWSAVTILTKTPKCLKPKFSDTRCCPPRSLWLPIEPSIVHVPLRCSDSPQ